ncbi:MAG: hypothetical protein LHV69_09785 [Elusimicrobia bacterium]|nr:hypothetical protein [Candidatus Obscuribacterium magneticum]
MEANKAEVGKKYLSKKGTAVTVMGFKGNKVSLKVHVSGNEVEVPGNYELRPFNESQLSKSDRILLREDGRGNGKRREGVMSTIIDPLLFEGKMTIQQIAEALEKKGGPSIKGANLEANVRARMVSARRKGWRVEKDGQKRVKVIPTK